MKKQVFYTETKRLFIRNFTRVKHLKKNVFFWKDKDGNPLWKDTFVYLLSNHQA